VIERIADTIARRPRDLELQLLDTVRHCDRALLAGQLDAVAECVHAGDTDLAAAFVSSRAAGDISEQTRALRAIDEALERRGVPLTRDLAVALNSKFLRPSSDTDTDVLVAALNRRWSEEQARLGCEIDVRVIAVAARRIPEIDSRVGTVLRRIGGVGALDESQVFNLLQSLLWLDCRGSCPDCIDRAHPYQSLPKPSRALLRALVETGDPPLAYGEPGWKEEALGQLADQYACAVACERERLADLKADLTQMLVTPVEVGFQQHYPAIERIERRGGSWVVGLVIRELGQG
jgi:hypothetical protein